MRVMRLSTSLGERVAYPVVKVNCLPKRIVSGVESAALGVELIREYQLEFSLIIP